MVKRGVVRQQLSLGLYGPRQDPLPFIEQQALYDRIKTVKFGLLPRQQLDRQLDGGGFPFPLLSAFPNEPYPLYNHLGYTNYAVSAGSNIGWSIADTRYNGVFKLGIHVCLFARKRKRSGFTLVELLVVIAIIGM